jgi:flagellar biosynthesis anti-sigma factor FlgM
VKINGDQTSIQLDAYLKKIQNDKAQVYQNQATQTPQDKGDQVELSEKARSMQQAAQALSAAELERTERVQQVKMEVEKGTYKVVGAKVATDMLYEAFENETLLNKIDTRA